MRIKTINKIPYSLISVAVDPAVSVSSLIRMSS